LLAFPGTLATAFAIAGALAWAGALPFGAALLFGAMISATDPVAVVAVFRRVGAPSDVRTIVEAESIANDGVAVVLYGAALVLALGGSVSWPASFAHGIVAVAGGIAIGAVCAAVVSWLVRTTNAAEYEVTATVALAYIAYLIADHMQLSGIFATAAGGVLLRYLQHRKDTVISNAEDADRFWNTGAYIANAIVFLSTGLAIDTSRLAHEPALIAIALVVAIGTRALLAFGVIGETRARLVVLVAGMRGALPLALALALPRTVPYRAEIIDAVFATVFVTLVVQGLPLGGFVARLYGERKRGEASTNASGDRPSTTL
jgi:CPA1 family monovalent cation:H+ antiporter